MKTNYSQDYLWNKYGNKQQDFLNQHRKELDAETGVTWKFFSTHGKYKFQPIVDFRKEQKPILFNEIQKVIRICRENGDEKFGISFVKIVELSGYSYETVEAVLYHLIKKLGCGIITDRGGNCVGVVLRKGL